jgi:hypothetical protein
MSESVQGVPPNGRAKKWRGTQVPSHRRGMDSSLAGLGAARGWRRSFPGVVTTALRLRFASLGPGAAAAAAEARLHRPSLSVRY